MSIHLLQDSNMKTFPTRTRWNSLTCALGLTLMLSSAGCSGGKPTTVAEATTYNSAEHHDHENCLLHDHGIPDHKPASFAEAVQELPRKQRLAVSELKVGHLDHAQEAIQKLQDVIRWLPELAADTDLAEADWNAVQALSRQMETVVQSWPTLSSQPPQQDVDLLADLIHQLKPFAEKTNVAQNGPSDSLPADAADAGGE